MSIANYDPFENRRQVRFHVLIDLLQPLSQISETKGNESLLKTTQLTGPDGEQVQVPIYSGNAQRNGNMGRRGGIASFLDSLGLSVNQATHQTLYSGGYIEGSTINDFDWECNVRQALPHISLLGGAVPPGVFGMAKGKSQMLEGRINIGDAYLICYETLPYLWQQCPALVPWEAYDAMRALMEARQAFVDWRYQYQYGQCDRTAVDAAYKSLKESERTNLPVLEHFAKPASEYWAYRESVRIPSHKQSELRRHMLAPGRTLTGETDDKKKPKKEAGRQMISGAWVIAAGAQLYSFWSTRGQGITELEEGCLVNTLLEFSKQPYLGGKGNAGCGLVSLSLRYEAGDESGEYLSLRDGAQTLSPRAEAANQRYQEMVRIYQDHVAELRAGTTNEARGALEMLGVD